MLKALTIAVAGVLTAAVIKQVMDGLNAAKAKASETNLDDVKLRALERKVVVRR